VVRKGSCREGKDLAGMESFGDLEDMSEAGIFDFQCKSTILREGRGVVL